MTEPKTYAGGCHCGRVRYKAEVDLSQIMSCNCSICRKRGMLVAPAADEKFVLERGEDALRDYQFNRKVIHHFFCEDCGVGSFARGTGPDGTKMVAINVRCLDDVDLEGLNIVPFDGKSL
jgi:hypothetical protein